MALASRLAGPDNTVPSLPGSDSWPSKKKQKKKKFRSLFLHVLVQSSYILDVVGTFWIWSSTNMPRSIRSSRFAAVSPFCFGYPTQPDIVSWRIRIIRISIDGRFPRHGLLRLSSSRQCTFFRFTGTMHGLLLWQACYSYEFKRRRFQKRSESGCGRCVESLDKALYSHCPKEKPSHPH